MMNIRTALLAEIAALSIEDRIHVVQEIWDGIAADRSYPDLEESQKREIDRRIDESNLNPENTLTWEDIKKSIKRK
jgi:putative addiction module component (TIGR02574 family)